MLTRIDIAQTQSTGVELYVLEDTQSPPIIRGNKRFKLSDNLATARAEGYAEVLSFGGAYSNHIHALAWAAREQGLNSIGIIRGDKEFSGNPTLRDAQRYGMHLKFVSRSEYRQRHDPAWLESLQKCHPDAYLIPEGGANLGAIVACKQMLDSLSTPFLHSIDTVACAIGSGATACGLSLALQARQTLRGYAVVADDTREHRMHDWLANLPHNNPAMEVISVEQPKYGKLNQSLCEFIDGFFLQTTVLLDPLYTGKMLQRLLLDIDNGHIAAGSTVVAMHTGGMQGWRGYLPACEAWLSATTLAAVRQNTAATTL